MYTRHNIYPGPGTAASPVLLLCFDFPVISFCSWSNSVYLLLYCFVLFCLPHHLLRGGHDTSLFILFCYFVILLLIVSLSCSFFSLSPHPDFASVCTYVCMSYLVLWQVIALSTLLSALCITISNEISLCRCFVTNRAVASR